jgi:TnpA family transposase
MKIARGRELLTSEQRLALMQIPEDEWILGTYFTLSKRDLEVVNKRRREENRLGFAVQLAVLRYPGWPYTHIKSIPDSVIHYISKQIGASSSSLNLYPQRENTLWDHLKEIRSEYDFVAFTLREYRMTFKHLHQIVLENGDAIHLLHECIDFLRKNKIILPAITTLEGMVWEAREMAEKKLFNMVSQSLSNEQKEKLEEIITSSPESNKTILGRLKEPPGHPSPETFLKVIDRLEYIRGIELETVNISHLHRNRLLQLSRLGSRYEPYAFRDFQENKRYSILTVYLLQLTQELTDKAFEIHDRQILSLLSKGRKALEEIQKQNGKKLNEKVIHFSNIGQALIKAREEKLDVFEVLESVIEWNSFVSSVEEAQELARPADYDYLDLLQKRFYSLRKYTPTLLRILEFHSTKANEPLLQAVGIIQGMNESGKRKVLMTHRWILFQNVGKSIYSRTMVQQSIVITMKWPFYRT